MKGNGRIRKKNDTKWKEIQSKSQERSETKGKLKKKKGRKEHRRKMKGNDLKMPFHLTFHYFMRPLRAGRADDKLSRGNERK